MNLIIQYGLLGLVLGLGLGIGFILYCSIWRPLALPYMCPQPTGPDGTLGPSRKRPVGVEGKGRLSVLCAKGCGSWKEIVQRVKPLPER